MAYDPNWPRWFQASVAKHFKTVANTNSYSSLVEELEERTAAFQESPQRVEIKINGPFAKEVSKDYWRFEVDVYVLISSHMDGALDNAYRGTTMAGIMAEAAATTIPVNKLGNGVDDDQSLIGCLTLRRGNDESIKVFHFGEIDPVNRLRQLGVDVRLEMFLCQ